MKTSTHITLARGVMLGSVLLFLAVLFLVFSFPKLLALWTEAGRELSAAEQVAANLSLLARQYGLLVLGLPLLSFIGALGWLNRVSTGHQSGR